MLKGLSVRYLEGLRVHRKWTVLDLTIEGPFSYLAAHYILICYICLSVLLAYFIHLFVPIHCIKGVAVFPSPAGMSLTKLFLGGNNLIFPAQGEFGP